MKERERKSSRWTQGGSRRQREREKEREIERLRETSSKFLLCSSQKIPFSGKLNSLESPL